MTRAAEILMAIGVLGAIAIFLWAYKTAMPEPERKRFWVEDQYVEEERFEVLD